MFDLLTASIDKANPDWLDLAVTVGTVMFAYVFSLYKGFTGAERFLRSAFPRRSKAFYTWADAALVTLGGSFFGFLLLSPVNVQQSIAAGLGWIAALSISTPPGNKSNSTADLGDRVSDG